MLLIVSCLRNRPSETQPEGFFFPSPSENLTSPALAEMFNITQPVCDFSVATFTYPFMGQSHIQQARME